jgi:integrase
MVRRTAKKAGINEAVSPHWLRHAHGSHAIDRGASLPEVQRAPPNKALTSEALSAGPRWANISKRRKMSSMGKFSAASAAGT